jgi:hypothetical protein
MRRTYLRKKLQACFEVKLDHKVGTAIGLLSNFCK